MSANCFELPDQVCPACGYKQTHASEIEDRGAPEKGDVSICFSCAQLTIFDADLRLRRATAEDIAELMKDPEHWAQIELTQRCIQNRGHRL